MSRVPGLDSLFRFESALCGYVFESFAIVKLEAGGEFKYRRLVAESVRGKSGVESLDVGEKCLDVLSSTSQRVEKVESGRVLFVPLAKNYRGMDAWMHGVGAFQMTVAKTHSISNKAYGDIAILGNKLYWVLPPLYYKHFRKQGPAHIEEYALLMPYPTALDQNLGSKDLSF